MVSLDQVFELFTDERRRLALYYLDERDGKVPVEELAATVEEWETESEDPPVPDGRYDDLAVSLEHKDLPKAAEAEFVEYDREANVVELTDEPREFSVVLSVAEAIEHPDDAERLPAFL